MKNLQAKLTSVIKKHKIISAIIALVTVLWVVVLCVWLSTIYASHSLGSKMEYLGKKNSGNIFGFDQAPSSDYYYGTDMEPEEMKNYFTAQYLPLENLAYKHASFTADGKDFMFTYEFQSSFTTHKKYIVSIPDSQYKLAKSHLK